MKVKQKVSSRRSNNDPLGTPLHKIKSKSSALDDTVSPAPMKFSSVAVHLNYVSPLGNVAGLKKRKKDKTPSKQERDSSVKLVLKCPSGNRKSRRRKSQAAEKILSEVLDDPVEVIVIPDTPTQCTTPGGSNSVVEEPETDEPRLDGLKDSSTGAETPNRKEVNKSTKRKKKSRSRDTSATNDVSVIADKSPSNVSVKWAVKSSICSNNAVELDGGDKDTSKKKKKRRKKVSCEADVTEVASPCKKKRTVTLDDEGEVSATVNNETRAENVTIDLETEDEAVTVLSDDDDADDIIVLGSPVVPSVRSYKAVSGQRAQARPPGDLPPGIIARAVAELGRTQTLGAPLFHCPTPTLPPTPMPAVPHSPANVYGGNIYNPGGNVEKKGLRPVIIDASNVAMGHGNGKVFSCRGIEICVNYFLKRKHKVFAFLPKFRRHNLFTKDAHLLDKLQADNHLIFTPSRYVDGQSDVPYDDRYIVQTAAELGGVIVSTDNYRDLLRENPHWHDTIKNRLLMFTWVEDILIFPQDPLGRRGCRLEEFLRF